VKFDFTAVRVGTRALDGVLQRQMSLVIEGAGVLELVKSGGHGFGTEPRP